MYAFNLVDEPWIPCVTLAGETAQYSLRDVLRNAGEIREISDPSPPIVASLHRLLLAILHRSLVGPRNSDQWSVWWRDTWDQTLVDAYLDTWQLQFELFDAVRPFYQTPVSFEYATPINKLVLEVSPNNSELFAHRPGGDVLALSPAQAARCLIATHAYAPGGLVGFEKGQPETRSADAGPLARGALNIVKGSTLRQTLVLNMIRYDPAHGEPFSLASDEDVPAWERPDSAQPMDRTPTGYLDLLTWQSRRIHLQPMSDDDQTVVRRAVLMKGYQFPTGYERHGKETMLAYRRNRDAKPGQQPWPVVGFREDRALWRDSLSLFQSTDAHSRARALGWLDQLTATHVLQPSETLPLDLYGICGDRANVFFWRHERLPLPLAYLQDTELVDRLKDALDYAERIASALQGAVRCLAELLLAPESDSGGHAADPKAATQLTAGLGASRVYWSSLALHFSQYLLSQAREERIQVDGALQYGRTALNAWQATVLEAAHAAFEQICSSLDTSGRALHALASAERHLNRDIYLIDHPKAPQPEVEHVS